MAKLDWLLMIILNGLMLIYEITATELACVCNTADCRENNEVTCTAKYKCFVQVQPGERGNADFIIRGCIDDRTPLLCENRRPVGYTGAWPVLHCCTQDWCNKDYVPTPPPQWIIQEKSASAEASTDSISGARLYSGDIDDLYDTSSSSDKSIWDVNPLYIGVPVAGAVVLLAIVIFAVYILKRQNYYIQEARHESYLKHKQMLERQRFIMAQDVEAKSMYSESEKSSTGSETRLLVKT